MLLFRLIMNLQVIVVLIFLLNVIPPFQSVQSPSHLRPSSSSNGDRACSLLIAVDELLFNHFQRNFTRITETVKDLVTGANDIYSRDIFLGQFKGIYFRVEEIRILFEFCPTCNRTARQFLDTFALIDFSQFCLAHLLTYRDFPDGLQGMAHRGAFCSRNQNTGFTSLLNHGVQTHIKDSVITFSHELGHNFGADHDENRGCSSKYIMASTAVEGNINRFSTCSQKSIRSHLAKRLSLRRYSNCLQPMSRSRSKQVSLCGNGIVEGSEECDCGLDYSQCADPCCYPANIDPGDRYLNSSATPCGWNQKPLCLSQWDPIWKFGLVAPWLFLSCGTVVISLGLYYDWRHNRIFFLKHEVMILNGFKEHALREHHQIQDNHPKPNSNFVQWHPRPPLPMQLRPSSPAKPRFSTKPVLPHPCPNLPPSHRKAKPILRPSAIPTGTRPLPRPITPSPTPLERPTFNLRLMLPVNQRPTRLPYRGERQFDKQS
ncbi:disintegrin and metalloproteinase domain-containing protein 10-like [Tigriopus californicus]|uniref:disintegrin and metalloproteinase domain-containing protein 10-like n=1 Tax=Tigriopus californicus TaxID=6832 RepID=UPI0027DA2D36|nr:disintegrin and metalloproteinase domain-containing protein 10-like [Tigriopus californicus]